MSEQFSNTTLLYGLQAASHILINVKECNGFLPKVARIVGYTPYQQRLIILNVKFLKERRLYNDMICVFKLFHGLINLNVNEFFTLSHNSTHGHASKILNLVLHIPMHSTFLLSVLLTCGTLYLIMLSIAPL